jgi:hypothetical protein
LDLVCVPSHDPARGSNLFVSTAAPNRITAQKLEVAAKRFETRLSAVPSPRIAVLIGGNSKAYKMNRKITEELCAQLMALAQNGYGLMITASRRTGADNKALLKKTLVHENIYFWDGEGDNPYLAFLARADFILVSADSTSMISEAASTGKPVYMIRLEGGTKRITAMHDRLRSKGIIRDFRGELETYEYEPLHDAQNIATEIKRRMNCNERDRV